MELSAVRNVVLSGEWDAEMRGIKAAKELGVKDFKVDRYIKGAKAYIASIKWEFDNRLFLQRAPQRRHFNAKRLNKKQLFAKLTKKEKEIIEKYAEGALLVH
jgi:hypothetical protein